MKSASPNVSPHAYVASTLLTAIGAIAIFDQVGFENSWFLAPVLVLALIYAAINFWRQQANASDFSVLKDIHWPHLVRKALARFIVWLVIILVGGVLYRNLPYYSGNNFQANFSFFSQLLDVYLVLGMPYFIVTLIFKSSRKEDFYDPAIRIIHIIKQITIQLFVNNDNKRPFRVLRNTYNRKVLLNLIMRAYFIPIMIIQVLGNILYSLNMVERIYSNQHILNILYLTATILWLTDIINAALNYCLESRWLENRSRSIDLTLGGWLVCFCCYEPLNMATGFLFPFAPFVATHNPQDLLLASTNFLIAIKIIEIIALSAHVYSDVSLGPSIVNITLKKLQTRGPYGIVRHPGTTSKLTMWLLQSMFYKQFWSIKMIYGYFMWAVIYVLRALTEERHLKKYPEYRQYMKKVKHRFIPWLF